MHAKLFARAQASIAFNTTIANNINTAIAQIDPRLFAFAYYSPVPLQKDTSAHACFYLAVMNMYSLIWDCGPMLNTLFYNLGRQQMKTLPVNVCKILSTWHNAAAKHKDWIAGIRSDVCHNNSEEYYFCRNSRQAHHNFLLNSSGKDFKLVTYTEADWAAVCRQWLYLCENFLTEYKHALAKLDMLPGPDKVAFAEIWLSYIAQWYERSADICSSVLADIYPVSLTNRGKSSRDIRKFELYRWVANGWRAISHTGDNNTDSYNAYIKFVDIGTYLKSPACPTPALPKDALSALFKKTAQKF